MKYFAIVLSAIIGLALIGMIISDVGEQFGPFKGDWVDVVILIAIIGGFWTLGYLSK